MAETDLINLIPVPTEFIERRIYLIRGQKVMLDSDLAELYQVPTKRLNEAVKRNLSRFPEDFMFQLNKHEAKIIGSLRSQFATLNRGGHRKYLPYTFTEHGVAMLSSILSSETAIQMNILIIRAFIKMKQVLAANESLTKKVDKIEHVQEFHDRVLIGVVKDIKKIKNPPRTNAIGFRIK